MANSPYGDILYAGSFQTAALILADGSITDSTGAISFGDENLVTTGRYGQPAGSGASVVVDPHVAGVADKITFHAMSYANNQEDLYFQCNNGWWTIASSTGQSLIEWLVDFKQADDRAFTQGNSNDVSSGYVGASNQWVFTLSTSLWNSEYWRYVYDKANNKFEYRAGAVTTVTIDPATGNILTTGTLGTGPVTILAGTAAAGTAPLKFTAGTDLATPEAGAVEYDGKSFSITATDQRRNIVRASDPLVATARADTIANTVLFTATINANAMYIGKIITVRGFGLINNQNAAAIATIVVKVNGTVIGTIDSPGSKLTDDAMDLVATFTVRSIGATGKVSTHLHLTVLNADNHAVIEEITVDTTAVATITFNVTWSAEHAENYLKLTQGWLTVDH